MTEACWQLRVIETLNIRNPGWGFRTGGTLFVIGVCGPKPSSLKRGIWLSDPYGRRTARENILASTHCQITTDFYRGGKPFADFSRFMEKLFVLKGLRGSD